ncbi:MAG: uracil-DNA glycosylase [bacterium]|nr:uracil-DNA glycosylase [Planctomycetota bacterium]HIL51743.1 uracil-DNA glycosylase [Planctomycetota bacterium]
MKEPEPEADPDCRACQHLFVTYEAAWPNGCRAFALKSRAWPAVLVRQSLGHPCRAFEHRQQGGQAGSQGRGSGGTGP